MTNFLSTFGVIAIAVLGAKLIGPYVNHDAKVARDLRNAYKEHDYE